MKMKWTRIGFARRWLVAVPAFAAIAGAGDKVTLARHVRALSAILPGMGEPFDHAHEGARPLSRTRPGADVP
jgi:hypothetical protein